MTCCNAHRGPSLAFLSSVYLYQSATTTARSFVVILNGDLFAAFLCRSHWLFTRVLAAEMKIAWITFSIKFSSGLCGCPVFLPAIRCFGLYAFDGRFTGQKTCAATADAVGFLSKLLSMRPSHLCICLCVEERCCWTTLAIDRDLTDMPDSCSPFLFRQRSPV